MVVNLGRAEPRHAGNLPLQPAQVLLKEEVSGHTLGNTVTALKGFGSCVHARLQVHKHEGSRHPHPRAQGCAGEGSALLPSKTAASQEVATGLQIHHLKVKVVSVSGGMLGWSVV